MILNEGNAGDTPADIGPEGGGRPLDEVCRASKKGRLSIDGCVYRGEGNANVVIALPCERKVLRFRKSSRTGEASADGGRARTTREIEFLKYVISGLLGGYVEPPESLRVTREEMTEVSEAIRPLRPEHRRRKEIVEDYATVFTDYAFIPQNIIGSLRNPLRRPTFCVEIKPKQGFRHEFDQQFKKCTYCLTQYHKLKNGAIKLPSSYCPHDLFSGDRERMKKSIRALLEYPQNNLKIFRDGFVAYDYNSEPHEAVKIFSDWFSNGETSLTVEQYFEKFFKIVHTSLTREFSAGKRTSTTKISPALSPYDYQTQPRIDQDLVSRAKRILCLTRNECNFTRNGDIPRGSVLGKILEMQQLPYLSSDLVYKVYSNHFGTLNDEMVYSQMIRAYRGENELSTVNGKKEADCSSNTLKSRARISDSNGNDNRKERDNVFYPVVSNGSLDFQNNNNCQEEGDNGKETEALITVRELEILQNYLLVTTAKDCSILMAFQEVDSTDAADVPAEHIVQDTDGVNFLVNVGVLDLDPKSIHCIEKHRQRDTSVLLALIDALEKELDFRN